MLSLAQCPQQRQHAVKQADVILVLNIVVTVTLPQFGVLRLGHIRGGMRQRGDERHADDIGRRTVIGHSAPHIAHRLLDAARDDARGVEQRAIPVKGDQVIAAGSEAGHGRGRLEVREGGATRDSRADSFAGG